MPYAVAGGAISAIGGIAGGLFQSNAASKAAAQAQQRFEQQRADLTPYRTAGLAPLQAQTDLLGLNGPDAAAAAMQNYQTSPGYQWQLGQGLRAVDAGAAAAGMLRSGATLKAEQTFGQGLANTDFGQYYNRLMGLTTLGENAAAGGASTANAAGAAAQQAGTTQASIYGNTASGLVGTVNNLLSDKNFQSWAGGLFGDGSAATGPNTTIGGFNVPDNVF
jgi:hypothetical protein